MNRRELLAAGAAALVPAAALAASAPAAPRGYIYLPVNAMWHPDEPYSRDSFDHARVLQRAVAGEHFPRQQWEALYKWVGVKPEPAFRSWVGTMGSDEPLRHTYMTLAKAAEIERSSTFWLIGSRGPVLYRLRGLYELQLFRRAVESEYLPRFGAVEHHNHNLFSSPGRPDKDGRPTVWIRAEIDYDLYLDPDAPDAK